MESWVVSRVGVPWGGVGRDRQGWRCLRAMVVCYFAPTFCIVAR